ncbi:MAG: Crp/Fnr family transcriptional regulator [Actinomycetales bacterium]
MPSDPIGPRRAADRTHASPTHTSPTRASGTPGPAPRPGPPAHPASTRHHATTTQPGQDSPNRPADQDFALLQSLSPQARASLLQRARRRTFARRDVVVQEGDPADSLHLVSSGRLAVRASTADGESALLTILVPGDYFGELALMPGRSGRRTATVLALEPAETLSIDSGTFRDLRASHPDVQEVVAEALARRVEDLSARLLEALYMSLDVRVCRRLDHLATIYADRDAGHRQGPAGVVIPLTQEALAEFVGGTRPSVNIVLRRLQHEGVIEVSRGRVTIRDRRALSALLG